MGIFPIVYGNNCQNQSVPPKTFHSYAYKNISWYIRYRTIMVAFRNKWSWGAQWGPSIRLYQEMGRFPIVYGNNCQNQSVTPKTFGSYAYKNISWYIRNPTIMVAFRNKLFRRPPRGLNKWEDFPVVFERNYQNRSVTPKTISSNGYKNLLRYIRNITIMVAFRNKWIGGLPWGLSIRMS